MDTELKGADLDTSIDSAGGGGWKRVIPRLLGISRSDLYLIGGTAAVILMFSTAIGALTGFVGIYLSYYEDVASGATIVLLAAGLFMVAMLVTIAKQYISVWPTAASPERRGGVVLPPDVDIQ